MDRSKAFDSISKGRYYSKKLLSKCNIGTEFNLLKNIYSHEKCQVKIEEYLSETISVEQGVSQGYILSPLLFISSDQFTHVLK